MTRLAPRAIAFDLDGTLVDSRHDLAEAVNGARRDLGCDELELETIVGMVGEGARNLVRRALGGEPTEDRLERALDRFYAHYEHACTRRTRPFPGVDAMLREAAERWPLALVTNKPERFSRRIVEHLGWSPLFAPLIGGDTLPTRKPDPAGLLAVALRHGARPAEVVLVGDSRIDADTAAAAGSGFVFVGWGFARDDERAELARGPMVAAASELVARLRDDAPAARPRPERP